MPGLGLLDSLSARSLTMLMATRRMPVRAPPAPFSTIERQSWQRFGWPGSHGAIVQGLTPIEQAITRRGPGSGGEVQRMPGSREEDAWLSDAELAKCAPADEAEPFRPHPDGLQRLVYARSPDRELEACRGQDQGAG